MNLGVGLRSRMFYFVLFVYTTICKWRYRPNIQGDSYKQLDLFPKRYLAHSRCSFCSSTWIHLLMSMQRGDSYHWNNYWQLNHMDCRFVQVHLPPSIYRYSCWPDPSLWGRWHQITDYHYDWWRIDDDSTLWMKSLENILDRSCEPRRRPLRGLSCRERLWISARD